MNHETDETTQEYIRETECGKCKHFHRWTKERELKDIGHPLHKDLWLGDCDKIPKGTPYEKGEYTYDGYSFCDENYNIDLHCFEKIEE